MNYFERYKQIISRLQELGNNIAVLRQAEWVEFNSLNEERAKLDATLVNAVKSQVTELDEAMMVFKNSLEGIKSSLERVQGPDGTPGDIMKMESIWQAALSLKEQISGLNGHADYTSGRPANPAGEAEQITGDAGQEKNVLAQAHEATANEIENSAITETAGDIRAAGKEAAAAGKEAETAVEPAFTGKEQAGEPAPAAQPKTVEKQKPVAGPQDKSSPADKKTPDVKHSIVIKPNKNVSAKKDKQNKKGSGKHPPLTIIPTKNTPCSTEDILLEEIKRNVASIKQGKR